MTAIDAKWAPAPLPSQFQAQWLKMAPGLPLPKRYVVGPPDRPMLNALVSRDEVGRDDMRWHISVTRPDRMPSWEDLVGAAHELRPGIVFVVGLPPRSWWINVHPHCLHLFETRDTNLVEQWRHEGRGDRPS